MQDESQCKLVSRILTPVSSKSAELLEEHALNLELRTLNFELWTLDCFILPVLEATRAIFLPVLQGQAWALLYS